MVWGGREGPEPLASSSCFSSHRSCAAASSSRASAPAAHASARAARASAAASRDRSPASQPSPPPTQLLASRPLLPPPPAPPEPWQPILSLPTSVMQPAFVAAAATAAVAATVVAAEEHSGPVSRSDSKAILLEFGRAPPTPPSGEMRPRPRAPRNAALRRGARADSRASGLAAIGLHRQCCVWRTSASGDSRFVVPGTSIAACCCCWLCALVVAFVVCLFLCFVYESDPGRANAREAGTLCENRTREIF